MQKVSLEDRSVLKSSSNLALGNLQRVSQVDWEEEAPRWFGEEAARWANISCKQ